MRVTVDARRCDGCGPCEEICPEVFKVVDNLARVLADPVPADAEQACRLAADNCPTGAIFIEGDVLDRYEEEMSSQCDQDSA